MNKRLSFSVIVLAGLGIAACQQVEEISEPEKEGWITLFDGSSLGNFNRLGPADWQLIDNYVEGDGYKGSFLVTKDSYRDFELVLDFWPSSDANSGVFMRCEGPEAIANETCIELNIMDEHPKRSNATGSIINLAPPLVEIRTADQWNTFEITAKGPHVVIRLNGTLVVDYEDERFIEGPIGFQNNGGLIRFRNIKIRPLASPVEENWAETISAAEDEGSVICACPPIGSLGAFLDAEWSAAYPGIALERTSAVGDWPSRIATERAAGVYLWDTYFWASNPPVFGLKNDGVFVPLVPELILPENADGSVWGGWENAFMDAEKKFLLGFRVELGSVSFNANEISPGELDGIDDLLDPKYKGKISIDDPRVAGGGDVFGAWFLKEFGADAWQSFLIDQEVLFAASKDEQAKGLARGPHYIAIPNPGAASLKPYADAGVQMDIRNLGNDSETAFLSIAYSVTGIFSEAPHPNAARVFTNWLLSRDIQEKLKRFAHNSRRLDVSPADPDKYPKPGVDYFYPQSEAAIAARETAVRLAREARPN